MLEKMKSFDALLQAVDKVWVTMHDKESNDFKSVAEKEINGRSIVSFNVNPRSSFVTVVVCEEDQMSSMMSVKYNYTLMSFWPLAKQWKVHCNAKNVYAAEMMDKLLNENFC